MKLAIATNDKRWVELETRQEAEHESQLSRMPGVLLHFDHGHPTGSRFRTGNTPYRYFRAPGR